MVLEQIEGNAPQDGEIFGGFQAAGAVGILAKDDIQYPMKAVFNRPVGADTIEEEVGFRREGADKVGGFLLHFILGLPLAEDTHQRLTADPTQLLRGRPRESTWRNEEPRTQRCSNPNSNW